MTEAINHLREALKSMVDKYPCAIGDECKCETCQAMHALSATSGFEE